MCSVSKYARRFTVVAYFRFYLSLLSCLYFRLLAKERLIQFRCQPLQSQRSFTKALGLCAELLCGVVGAGFFDILVMPIVRGRAFERPH